MGEPDEQSDDTLELIGRVLDTRYRVDAIVGEGGFGIVYRGYHLAFEHAIAIKVMKVPPHFDGEARRVFLERFRQEGLLLSKLSQCPGAVRVFDFGAINKVPPVPYLVLEWLEGESLDKHLYRRLMQGQGPFAPDEAIRLLLPAVEALAVAHEAGFAHRDVKPENLHFTNGSSGAVLKLLDFGIAKAMSDGASATRNNATSSGFHAFSPPYGAPEQFSSKQFGETGPWTDMHAVGLVLIEMISGRRAIAGTELAEWLVAGTSPQRPTLRAIGITVPEELERVIAQLLALRPADRIRDAVALRSLLGSLVARDSQDPTTKPSVARSGTVLTPPAPLAFLPGPASLPTPPPRTTRGRGAHRGLLIGGTTLGLLALGAGVWATSDRRGGSALSGASAVASSGAAIATDGVRAYRAFDVQALEGGGKRELLKTEAEGTHHVEATFKGSKLVEVRTLLPSGLLMKRVLITRRPDGAAVLEYHNSYGVLDTTDVVTAEWRISRKLRDGTPTLDGCASRKLTLDETGRPLRWICVDIDGRPADDQEGCVTQTYEHDATGQITAMRCFGRAGEPTFFGGGHHKRTFEYDERGFVLVERFQGLDSATGSNDDGCAAYRYRRDEAGNQVETTCLDTEGKPQPGRDGSPPTVRGTFDSNGCSTGGQWFDASGAPTTNTVGYHRWVDRRDNRCSLLSRELRTLSGALTAAASHLVPSEQNEFDAEGNRVVQRCQGPSGPVSCVTGEIGIGSLVRFKYDPQGRRVSRMSYTSDGVASRCCNGYPHETRTEYLANGLTASEAFFDEKGQPATAIGTAHRQSFTYNERRQRSSTRSWGGDDKPIVTTLGCHELKTIFDDQHRIAQIECRGTEGELRVATMVQRGVDWGGAAQVKVERGERLFNVFLGPGGEVVRRVDCLKAPCLR